MSKKQKIIELLEKDEKDIEEICTELNVSSSYVYRIQREINEFKGDSKDSIDSKDDDPDDLAVNIAGGVGDNVEEDNNHLEEEENSGDANNVGKVGGVKKKKNRIKKQLQGSKKQLKVDKVEEKDEKNSTFRGVKTWMKTQWKKVLLGLMLLSLLIIATISYLTMKPREPTENLAMKSRFPVLR